MPGRTSRQTAASAQSGAAVSEFALGAAVLGLVLGGIADLSRLFWVDHTVQMAAASAARFAGVRGSASSTPASTQDVIEFFAAEATGLAPGDYQITVAWTPNNQPRSTVTVSVTYAYRSLFGSLMPTDGVVIRTTPSVTILN